MNPVKCKKCNLFYDGEKYTECPHCAKGGELPKRSQPTIEKHRGADKVNNEQTVAKTESKKAKPEKKGFLSGLFKKKNDKKQENKVEKPARPSSIPVQNKDIPVPSQKKPSVQPEPESPNLTPVPAPAPAPAPNPAPSPAPSLEAAIKGTDSVAAPGDRKTEARYNFSNSIEPVNGWLVCIEGEYKGTCFNIKEGRNNIGRSLTMDIALAKEKSVSRERHASVIFEPNNRVFYIQSGESSGLTYVNGELVLAAKELKENDVINLGRSSFVFIEFSGEHFNWEDYAD